MDPMSYQDVNARTIDRWVEEGWEWGVPITHEQYAAALRGEWDVLLTPTKPVPHSWFGELKGKKVLGLASGGGQQAPIFAALGAEVTVLDYSEKQLESERETYRIQSALDEAGRYASSGNYFAAVQRLEEALAESPERTGAHGIFEQPERDALTG